jgi:hypothetical protein
MRITGHKLGKADGNRRQDRAESGIDADGAVSEQDFLVGRGEYDLCPLLPKPDGLSRFARVAAGVKWSMLDF